MVDMVKLSRATIGDYFFFTIVVLLLLLVFISVVDVLARYVTIENLSYPEVVSLVVAEVPAAIILRYILGLGESEEKKAKDREELAKAIALAVHQAFEEERNRKEKDN
jgi:hypothetical protein